MTKRIEGDVNRRQATRVLGLDLSAESKELELLNERGVTALAKEHTPFAVATLVRMLKNQRTPPAIRRQIAMDLIQLGNPQLRDMGKASGPSGVTINILRMSDGGLEVHAHPEASGAAGSSGREAADDGLPLALGAGAVRGGDGDPPAAEDGPELRELP